MNEEGKLKLYIGEMEYILFVEKKKILKMVHACLAYQVME